MDAFDAPSLIPQQTGPVKNDRSMDEMMERMAKLELENERLKAQITEPANAIIKEEPVNIPAPPPPIDATIVTDKNGKLYDFKSMMLFEVRKMAKEYKVAFTNESKKEEIVPLLIDAIEKQKENVAVAG